MNKQDVMQKYECNDNGTYEYFSFDTPTSVPEMKQDSIVFTDVYNEDVIYDTFLSLVRNNSKVLERDLIDKSGVELERNIYIILNIASAKIAADGRVGPAKFAIMNSTIYNILKPQFDVSNPSFSIIVDDDMDDIILGRVSENIDEPKLICFHDGKNMVIKATPQSITYNQYHIVKLTNLNV